MELTPVGYVVGGRAEPEDDRWGAETAVIRLADAYGPECLLGLDAFSHVEVVFHFDRATEFVGARHPRGNPEWPLVGVFGQRGKDRPNRLGISRARLLKVDGRDVLVQGLDAIDGTPVLDLKPWMAEFGPQGETTQPAWATELMSEYW